MAKQRLSESLSSDITDIVADEYEVIESKVQAKVRTYSRRLAGYEKKAEAYDVICKYLRNGVTEVDEDDEKKVGAAYAKKLQQIVNLNKRLEDSKEVPELKKQVAELTRARDELQRQYDRLQSVYDKKIENLRKRYARAEFVQKKLQEIRDMPYAEFKAKTEDEDAFLKSTHYPPGEKRARRTEATDVYELYADIYSARQELERLSKEHKRRIDLILDNKDPDKPDNGSGEAKKPAEKGRVNKPKKRGK